MESRSYLDTYERWLWDVTKYYLGDNAEFSEHEYSFALRNNPFPNAEIDPGPYKIGKNVEDAHIYRPGHSLAQQILTQVRIMELKDAEIVFDYTNNPTIVSVLQPLVGKSGVLKVSNHTVEAFETEDVMVLSAIDDSGEIIDAEIIEKIFSLSAQISKPTTISPADRDKLEELDQQAMSFVAMKITDRNGTFFDDEVDKLDKWADDVKKALDLDLRKLEIDIKTAKTNAKKMIDLADKLKAQKEIKAMEADRNEKRKQQFEAHDQVEQRKESLINKVEAQLKQKASSEQLFTIRWKIV